ncbi:glycoside hydrolase family protein [Streptomyces catenulae]|uniref:Glycoside hydrolase family protein n=1 Tax=Streptomyces catenulae TaxID=66875 RepID=A0ABV2YZZ6_9ACTN|nr:glycoside hydrolase family protein [Streptomyces catenulae]
MRRRSILTAALAAPLVLSAAGSATALPAPDDAPATATGRSAVPKVADGKKKGVSAWNFDGDAWALADSGAGWFYTWSSGRSGIAAPDGVEFVPMIWGPGSVTDDELNQAKQQGTTLLGFNEPDHPGQATMPVEQALDLWPRLQSTGLRLGAPAVATGADTAGGWLDRFLQGAAGRGLTVDFVPVHWYGGDFDAARATDQLRGYLQATYDRHHKPLWLTEYALIDFSSGTPRYPSQEQQAAFVQQSTAMLQGLPFVERYAWFTLSTSRGDGTGLYDGTTATQVGAAYRAAG